MSRSLRFIGLLLLAISMFIHPQDVVSSALNGINLWWNYVLPALLPFLILSELLMGGGFVHFLGTLLEPLMRPLFRLPGSASFVITMGYTSGFPMGAILTARLRQQGDLTREEGERLLSFTNNPSPGFILGAVSAGMLGRPELGMILAGSVYLSNLTLGILSRFLPSAHISKGTRQKFSPAQAWRQMHNAQQSDNRSFGQLLGDAVKQSISTVMAVGGFIIFFAVVIRLLVLWHVPALLATALRPIFGSVVSGEGIEALVNGLMEMTLGCRDTIAAFPQLDTQIVLLTLLMSWGGISVFAQIAGLISATDLRFSRFILARAGHVGLALMYSKFFLRFLAEPASTVSFPAPSVPSWLVTFQMSVLFFIAFLLIAFLVGLTARISGKT